MEGLEQIIKRHAYNSHTKQTELLEPVFHLFLTDDKDTYLIRDVAKITNVPLTTRYTWRERMQNDSNWCLSRLHFSENAREFPGDVEQLIASFIRINFVPEDTRVTRTTLQLLILMLLQDMIAQNVFDERHLAFKCSSHFLSRFLKRVGFSFR
jgi:hypothetical protein